MNLKSLRAEWRTVRKASLRLTHHSLSLFGLLSAGVIAVVATHPEYAQMAGRWMAPGAGQAGPAPAMLFSAEPTSPLVSVVPDPLVGAIVHPGSEAGRMLGLVTQRQGLALPNADVVMEKVSIGAGRPVSSREQRDATNYLSRKYRVNSDAIAMLVDAAYVTGKDLGLDPLLLLSVMGVESGFNPFAESTAGASGLMQLMSKIHRDKLNAFGGPNIALNPVVNLRVGAVVLKDCIRRGGSIVDGLRLYVGAGMGDDGGYGSRVLQEKDRLVQAVRGVARPRAEPAPVDDTKSSAPDVHARVKDVKPDVPDAVHPDPLPEVEQGWSDEGRVAAL